MVSKILSLAVAGGIPVYLRGAPGVGKTALVRAVAEGLGLHLEVVITALHDPTDFSGLPVKVDGRCVFAPPEWAVRLVERAPSLLFLDELSVAPPAVQAAALRVVHERVVGYLRLPESVRVVAAGNRPEDSEAVWDLTPPLANRFLHLSLGPSAESVVDYFLGGHGFYALARPRESWEAGLPGKKALVASFLRARPDLLHAMPRTGASGAWPSPRTWEMAARFLALAEGVLASEEVLLGVAGCVGEGAAVEFLRYLENLDLPDPRELLRGKAKLPEEPDKLMAALSAVAAVAAEEPEHMEAAFALVARAAESCPDVAVVVAKALAQVIQKKGLPAPKSVLLLKDLVREMLGL